MTTEPTDLYAILGLNRHATQAQISYAYRTQLRRYHPDTRRPGDPSQDAVSDAALQQVLTAYAVLRDPGRRADYDQRYATRPAPTRPSPTIAEAKPILVSWTGSVTNHRSTPDQSTGTPGQHRSRRLCASTQTTSDIGAGGF